MPRGHFKHKGRLGLVGGSLPKGQTNLGYLFKVLKGGTGSGNFGHGGRLGHHGGSAPGKSTVNSIATNWINQVKDLGQQLDIETVKKWRSLSVDERVDLAMSNRDEYERIKGVEDNFRNFQVDANHPLTESLGTGQVKEVLNRLASPELSAKELSKAPTKDNYKQWMWQKYSIVADGLSGENAKRYAQALDSINEKHGVVGGFFLKGVDAAWQRQGERGGNFDSAYQTIHVPTRLAKGGWSDDAKDVLSHEYGHYLDGFVLGQPTITLKKATSSRGGQTVTMRDDTKDKWLTSQAAERLGYSKESKPGWVQYDVFQNKKSSWYRDPSKIKTTTYKDYSPHELMAEMFEDHMMGRLSKATVYSQFELDWFNNEVLPKL